MNDAPFENRKSKIENLSSLSPLWAEGKFDPVYLFAGPEPLQKDEALESLRGHFLKGSGDGLNLDVFDGETAPPGQILNAYLTLPFLGGGRLIVVRRAQELSTDQASRLAEALEKPPASNCLVLLWDDKPDGRSALVRAARDAGRELMFWVPFEDQLPRWITQRAQSAGKKMSPDAARALLETVGPNLADLAQEVTKLALYVKDRASIEQADVEAMGGGNRTLPFMEWDRALWTRDRKKSLELLQVMRSQGQPPEALIAQAVKAFQKVLLGKALRSEGKSIMEVWDQLWIKTRGPRQDLERAIEGRGWEDLLEGLESLARTETGIKTGAQDPDIGLTLLVRKLTASN